MPRERRPVCFRHGASLPQSCEQRQRQCLRAIPRSRIEEPARAARPPIRLALCKCDTKPTTCANAASHNLVNAACSLAYGEHTVSKGLQGQLDCLPPVNSCCHGYARVCLARACCTSETSTPRASPGVHTR